MSIFSSFLLFSFFLFIIVISYTVYLCVCHSAYTRMKMDGKPFETKYRKKNLYPSEKLKKMKLLYNIPYNVKPPQYL